MLSNSETQLGKVVYKTTSEMGSTLQINQNLIVSTTTVCTYM